MALFQEQPLFRSGENGYFRYRIPALITSRNDTVLAFCEARRYTGRDADQIDLLLRRSVDGGKTFAAPRRIVHEPGWVCGNPAPVLERDSGAIWLLFCKNRQGDDEGTICSTGAPRTLWLTCSEDDGISWSEPTEITADVKQPSWAWYATGPGHGIQLTNGRLLIPCNHSLRNPDPDVETPYFAHVIISDDRGRSWRLGGSALEGTNECTLLESADGRVYLNSRNAPYSLAARCGATLDANPAYTRATAWSSDGGETFSLVRHDPGLPEPICQASICRVSDAEHHDRNRVIFVNPAGSRREKLTARLSYDECGSWPVAREIHAGPAGYSDLTVLDDGTILCLYERGERQPYETLTLARFSRSWLETEMHQA